MAVGRCPLLIVVVAGAVVVPRVRPRPLHVANDVTQASALMHGEQVDVSADAGYRGVATRKEPQGINTNWYMAMRPGKNKRNRHELPQEPYTGHSIRWR